MALQLKKAGVSKVHPLEGGLEAWLEQDLPVEPISEEDDSFSANDLAGTRGASEV